MRPPSHHLLLRQRISRRDSQYLYEPFLVSSALALAAFFFAFLAAFFSSSLTGAVCYVSATYEVEHGLPTRGSLLFSEFRFIEETDVDLHVEE